MHAEAFARAAPEQLAVNRPGATAMLPKKNPAARPLSVNL
jgi:hypothetical protein